MKDRFTQILLAVIAALLFANLLKAPAASYTAQAQPGGKAPEVLRAQLIELVDKQGQARAQLFLGEDGGGNLRLREGSGEIRVKLGATKQGGGLLVTDGATEPAIWALADGSGTTLKLAQKGKQERIIRP